MKRWLAVSTLVVLALVGLVLGGCSTSPLAPGSNEGTPATGSPPMLSVASDGHGEYLPCDTTAYGEHLPPTDTTGSRCASETCTFDGGKGGTMCVGRFTLELPAGAFEGLGKVTMSMRDTTVLVCDLELALEAGTLNAFRVPVRLTADLTRLNVLETDVSIYWYDPNQIKWEEVPAQSKTGDAQVTAYLGHFSRYGAGKAGW